MSPCPNRIGVQSNRDCIGLLVHWFIGLLNPYTLRSAGVRELDTLVYYRHIAPLERKDIYLLHRGEQQSLLPAIHVLTTGNLR